MSSDDDDIRARLRRLVSRAATPEDREWLEKLPRRPGPTPDTEFMQSPHNGLWYRVPRHRVRTLEEIAADCESKLALDSEGNAKESPAAPAAEKKHWVDNLPTRPGPTPDTEYVRSPWDGREYLMARIPTLDELLAELKSRESLSPETLAKIDRANAESPRPEDDTRRIQ